MTDIIKTVCGMGGLEFTTHGKLPAVMLAALLFLWLTGRCVRRKAFFVYAASAVAACVIPVTAAMLSLYQTSFYDGFWIWSMVPMTAVTAWGIAEFLDTQGDGHGAHGRRQVLKALLLLGAVLILCGGLNHEPEPEADEGQRLAAAEAAARIEEKNKDGACLWAPQGILEHVREQTGAVTLLYGKNMWDEALNAYSFDTYSPELTKLYLWMENTGPDGTAHVKNDAGDELTLDSKACMAQALEAGANCVVLPDSLDEEAVETLARFMGGSAEKIEGYYLLTK